MEEVNLFKDFKLKCLTILLILFPLLTWSEPKEISKVTLLLAKKIEAKDLEKYQYKVKDGVEIHLLVENTKNKQDEFTLGPSLNLTWEGINYKKKSELNLKDYHYDPHMTIYDQSIYLKRYKTKIPKSLPTKVILTIKLYGEKIPVGITLKASFSAAWNPSDDFKPHKFEFKL